MERYESGIVSEVHEGYVVIKTTPSELCSCCGAKSFCRSGDSRDKSIRARASIPLSVGDSVYFETDQRLVARYSVAVYLLPSLALVGGILLGGVIAPSHREIFSALSGAAAFFFVAFLLRVFYGRDRRIPAVVTGRVTRSKMD